MEWLTIIYVVIILISLFLLLRSLRSPQKRKKIKEKGSSKGERKCKSVLRRLFPRHSFCKVRPSFLKNPYTGKNLEIDLYCDELKLGIEYNGEQHYKYKKYFHRNDPNKYVDQRYRDEYKKFICAQNNITLLEVPYYVTEDDIETLLRAKIEKLNSPKILAAYNLEE